MREATKKRMEKKPGACLFVLPDEWRNTWPTLLEDVDAIQVNEVPLPVPKGQPEGFHPLTLRFSRGPAEVEICALSAERLGYSLQIVTSFRKPSAISIGLASDLEKIFLDLGWEVVFCTWRGVEVNRDEYPE